MTPEIIVKPKGEAWVIVSITGEAAKQFPMLKVGSEVTSAHLWGIEKHGGFLVSSNPVPRTTAVKNWFIVLFKRMGFYFGLAAVCTVLMIAVAMRYK